MISLHVYRLRIKYRKFSHRHALVSSYPRRHKVIGVATLVCAIGLTAWLTASTTATQRTINLVQDDFLSGTSNYGDIKIADDALSIQLQDGVVGSWDTNTTTGLQSLPSMTDGISNLVYGPNDTLYHMTAFDRHCHFNRYDIATQNWTSLNTAPVACGAGNTLVFDGDDSLYYTPGGTSTDPSNRFFRYNISSDSWEERANFPSAIANFSSSAFVSQGSNKYIYVFRGMSSPSFWRYTVATNSWDNLASYPTSGSVSEGIQMAWDGADTIYAIANYTGEFKRYSISTGTWTNLATKSDWNYIRSQLTYADGVVFAATLRVSGESLSLQGYDVLSQTWSTYPTTPTSANTYDYPSPITYDGSQYLYTIMGPEIRPELHRYDIINSTWNEASIFSNAQNTNQYHQSMIYDGAQTAYFFGGTYTNYVDKTFKYDLSTQSGTRIGSQIDTSSGNNGVYKDGLLYVMPTSGTTFQSYDPVTDDFVALTSLPLSRNNGADIVDGGDGYLYTTFGGGSSSFQRYNISSNTWGALTSMPRGIGNGGNIVRINRSIYALGGSQSGFFMKYNMDTNVWSSLDNLPNGSIDYGGFLIGDTSRYLYAGLSTRISATYRKMYRYDTTTDTWQRIADLPAAAKPYAGGFYDHNNDVLYVAQGQASATIWKWSPDSSSYIRSGSWYSKTYDLTQVESWQSLSADITGDGTTTFYTRTSSDSNHWTDWQVVSGTAIASPTNRYLQIKIDLTGDGTSTPNVSNISLAYDQETIAPTLPPVLTAQSEKDGTVLISGQTYEYEHPYFSWTGADDGANGAGVDGYYVYFGLDSNADPVTNGNYQTASDYTVSTPMTAGDINYLRIKVKDRLGNISSAATYFSYRYFYISPPASVVKTSSGDFSSGTNTNVSIADGSMQLSHIDTGAWGTGTMANTPDVTSGGASVVVGDSIYVARGSNTTAFWRYDITTQTWNTLSTIPETVDQGSSLAYDYDTNMLYLLVGKSSTGFYEYDITNDVWADTGADLPSGAQPGSDLAYIGGGKFVILFTGVREFYMFDTADNSAQPLQSYPTTITRSGSGIWFDGDNTIYAYLGGWSWASERNSRVVMAKYTISADSWHALATPSATQFYTENNLVSDGRGNLYVVGSNRDNNKNANQRMMKYNIASDSWSEVRGYFAQSLEGTMASDGKRYIYIFPDGSGTNSRKIIRYDSWTGNFSPKITSIDVSDRLPYDSPTNAWQWYAGNASTAAYDGNKYVYALAGDESTGSWSQFVKFDLQTGDTQYLPQPPFTAVGGSLSYLDDTLYYVPARSTRVLYQYNSSSQQWQRLTDAPGTIYRPGPSNLVAANGALYLTAGNGSSFYKYTPGSSGGTWATLPNSPGGVLNGSAVYDADTDAIFVLSGWNSDRLYRYDIGANSWSERARLPMTSSYGSAMTVANGKIYAQRGWCSQYSFIYDIGSNSWSAGPNSPEIFCYGATFLKITDEYAIAIAGDNTPDLWRFTYPTETTAYNGLATHVSEPMTIAGLYDYAGISVEASIPDDTRVEMWTRTSDNGTDWDDWSIASNIKNMPTGINGIVTSTPQRYTQIKLILESDTNMYTPTVDSYTLSYYFDVDPPQNPTVISVHSDDTQATEVESNIWYSHARPKFDWPDPGQVGGATDGPLGSNIAGYWVYLGTDSTASPRTQGLFVSSSDYTPTLSISGTYYLRLQTQDITGNVDGTIYAPFVYKFDNNPPTNPSLITVTPSGFTTFNDYTYVWPNAFDANSGVAGYCYHTGATSGVFAVETCQTGTSLENVSTAYRSGTNVFYLRTYDKAGNYSPSYTTVSYYYSTDPPGPATNLRAIPPTSTENMFAFAWDLPAVYSGDPDQLTYCYSINILPSPTNTTCTSERFIAAFKAATQQGTNILYIATKDEANNVNWNTFATANFIANTVSPGIPLNLVVSDTSDRVADRWSLTMTWDAPTFEGNGIKDYIVERSEDNHTFDVIGKTTTRAFVDLDVTASTTYYYRVRAEDGVDNAGGASAVVAKSALGNYATPPAIVTPPAANTDSNQALVTWTTDRSSSSFVYYGTSPTDLSQSKGSLDAVTNHSQLITGLLPSTVYYYRVQSFDDKRSYNLADAYSEIFSFRTTAAAQITNVKVSDLTTSTAVISWNTSTPTKSRISYGPTSAYGLSNDDGLTGYASTHTMKLTNLSSGTQYHFGINSTTEFGSSLTSDDYTFQTIARPVISNVRFQPINDESTAGVEVTWDTNVGTTSTVQYSAFGTSLESSTSDLVTKHNIKLQGLASNSNYQIVLSGRDQYGNLVTSAVQNWTSDIDTRAPETSDESYTVNVTGTGNDKKAQLIVSWTTDEPSTSQVRYGSVDDKELDNESPLDTEATTNHVVIVSNLDLASIYSVQIVSRDLNGNTELSARTAIVTPDKEVSIFDKILDLMIGIFRF